MSHFAHGLRKGFARPLSPHLSIYDLKLNAQASVLFRGTGMVLTGGIAGIAIGSIVAPGKTTDYIKCLQQYPFVNAVVKFGVAFPLTYHALGGVRHMFWDQAKHQNIPWVTKSAKAAIAASAVVGAIAAVTEFKK